MLCSRGEYYSSQPLGRAKVPRERERLAHLDRFAQEDPGLNTFDVFFPSRAVAAPIEPPPLPAELTAESVDHLHNHVMDPSEFQVQPDQFQCIFALFILLCPSTGSKAC